MRPFNHLNARSLDEAAEALRQPGAVAMAGGGDLLGALKDDIARDYPRLVVNLKTIPGLDGITVEDGYLRIGALCLLGELSRSEAVLAHAPMLADAAGKWPHEFEASEIDAEYYDCLPSVPRISGQLHVACTPLDGEERYVAGEDGEAPELIELCSPVFSTEREAEHFKAAITKKYHALAKRNGTIVTAWLHEADVHALFDPERRIYVLDNYCE